MQIIKRATMPDGTKIQIESWSDNYKFYFDESHIAAYPKAKRTQIRCQNLKYPEEGKEFRLSFYLGSKEKAESEFEALRLGNKSLLDLSRYASDEELLKYI